MRQGSKMTIKFLCILIYFGSQAEAAIDISTWSCAGNVTGFPFNIENISGVWYEAARMPDSEVPACVQVTVPSAITNETLNLRLDYVNNLNNKWKPTTETLTFPWNNNTQRGIFEIKYGNEEISMDFIFKIVVTDFKKIAIICYYTNYVPALSMIKIMTRQPELNETTKNTIQDFADMQGLGSHITWVQQSGRCNNAQVALPLASVFLSFIVFVSSKMF